MDWGQGHFQDRAGITRIARGPSLLKLLIQLFRSLELFLPSQPDVYLS
jgi:hypothetical protein